MVHWLSIACPVFIHDGESRGTDSVFPDTQTAAEGCCESGLTGAHRSVEGDDFPVSYFRQEFPCGPVQVIQVLDVDLVSHGYLGLNQISGF